MPAFDFGVAKYDVLKLRLMLDLICPHAYLAHHVNLVLLFIEADREGHCAVNFCILDVFKINEAFFRTPS